MAYIRRKRVIVIYPSEIMINHKFDQRIEIDTTMTKDCTSPYLASGRRKSIIVRPSTSSSL